MHNDRAGRWVGLGGVGSGRVCSKDVRCLCGGDGGGGGGDGGDGDGDG